MRAAPKLLQQRIARIGERKQLQQVDLDRPRFGLVACFAMQPGEVGAVPKPSVEQIARRHPNTVLSHCREELDSLSRPFQKFANVFLTCTGRRNMRAYTARERRADHAPAKPLSDCAGDRRTPDVDGQGGEIHAPVFRGAPREDDFAGGRGLVE